MRAQTVFLLFFVLSIVICVSGLALRRGNIDYLEALRRMQQIPQWHCMRYRRFHPHGHCSRWWLTRRT
ncbi:unnamed protein product [Colias eurytheme]|nr:unnamed protein product [Colias eurytheme]